MNAVPDKDGYGGVGDMGVGRLGRLFYFRQQAPATKKNPRQSAESVQIRDSDNYTTPEESVPHSHGHTRPPTPPSVHTPRLPI